MRERTAQSASAQEEPASEPTRVLVVEDYDSTREALAGALEEAGFRVDVAVSGREAIAKAILEQPDVILMDLSLPGLDGTEATQMIKADDRTRHILVIAVSGNKRREQAALDAGCEEFVPKPFAAGEVEERIRRLLRGKAGR